jgi:hypothetical protein
VLCIRPQPPLLNFTATARLSRTTLPTSNIMANGLDRIERFFSKRKLSTEACEPASAASQNIEQTFPAPSFIRPKTSRMTAREEVRAMQNCQRSDSVSAPFSRQREMSVSTGCRTSSDSQTVQRASTDAPHNDTLMSGLSNFHFPQPSNHGGEILELRPCSRKNLLAQEYQRPMSPRSKQPVVLLIPAGVDTPPSSEPDEDRDYQPFQLRHAPLSEVGAPPSPSQSPEFSPARDPRIRDSKISEMVDYQTGLSSRHGSFCSSTLREPDFHDFLNLSDDDIAEAAPESLDPPYSEDSPQRLPSMGLAITSAKPRPTSLLTLTTQRATHVATAAAFEAARIAKRYDFDLVYVVNLWPNRPGHRSTPSGSSVKTCASEHGTTSQRPLVGKLLAAHGLHHVPTPLQISSSVHSTILRKDGWVEYRNSLAEESDLARGYACAFHKGQYNSKAGILDAGTPVSGVRLSEKIDRGIVFAAYRKPRHDESRRLGTDLKQDELRQLHEDAEALVEMVLDIHVTNRSRLPLTPTQLADDIGPIPSEQTKLEDI